MIKVAIVYHILPHYREAIALALDSSKEIEYTFFSSGRDLYGIKHADVRVLRHFVQAPVRFCGSLMWQFAAVKVAFSGEYDVIVFFADPHFVTTWIGALVARLCGKGVLFWAHGWLRKERGLKVYFRHTFYSLCNRILVYGERSRLLGIEMGFSPDRIRVVFNSLDCSRADGIFESLEAGMMNYIRPSTFFEDEDRPVLICTARLVSHCRLDILIRAVAILRRQGILVNTLLVGEGPEQAFLSKLALENGVPVCFYGPCYDEDEIGQLIYRSDLTVSPGKVGLTAIHSLMYGTPVVSHNNLDDQMPEVEAVVDGLTGILFKQNSAIDLALRLSDWLAQPRDRGRLRASCRAVVHSKWNPRNQARLIEAAILESNHG